MKPEVEAAVARVTEAIAAEHRKWSMHGSEPEVRVEAYDLRTLITALREAERDAARYRWLRNDADSDNFPSSVHEALQLGGDSLDAAIDAAIAKGAGND